MAQLAGQRTRSDRGFERLYRRHVEDVYRYALAVLANPADAEDVTQTAFLNAYRAFQAGQRPERPLNWLIAIAHNVCRQRFRDGERRPREVVLDRELAAGPADDGEEPFRREDILRALSQLGFNQRAALVMRELEGRSYAEIGEILDVSVAAVETLIFRARRAFREQLEGALTCSEAERAISRDLDGMLERSDKSALRAHLRSCSECATLARRFRAQRGMLKGIGIIPLPHSLTQFSAAGGSGLAGSVALHGGLSVGAKVAALGASAVLVAGVSSETVFKPSARNARPAAGVVSAPVRPSRSLAVAAKTTVARDASAQARHTHPSTAPRRQGGTPSPGDATEARGVPSSPRGRPEPEATYHAPVGSSAEAAGIGDRSQVPSAAKREATGEGKAGRDSSGSSRQKPGGQKAPPGQTKERKAPPGQANDHSTPPGQAKGHDSPPGYANGRDSPPGQANGRVFPPGQANGHDSPPGQANGHDSPPGQANGHDSPPGQANGQDSPPGSPPSSPGPPGDQGPPPNAGNGSGGGGNGNGSSSNSNGGGSKKEP
jgi:RNA polymerase sigma factor (sigma-70 family)